jgi:hypothetical protein
MLIELKSARTFMMPLSPYKKEDNPMDTPSPIEFYEEILNETSENALG